MRVSWCFFISLLLFCHAATATTILHHNMDIRIKPKQGYLETTDRITIPENMQQISLRLHAKLKLHLETLGARIISVNETDALPPIKQYKIAIPAQQHELKLRYSGRLQHRTRYNPHNLAASQNNSIGIISEQGIFLGVSSFWFPMCHDSKITFELHTTLPAGWSSISQGKNTGENSWKQTEPQDGIYLIAGRYNIYQHPESAIATQVYLLQPDRALAQRYLRATKDYLQLFSKLLGAYPHPKFALVENTWKSGYSIPSFTLLGSQAIRLPFVLDSSYPHEILHNWFGNGVLVDYANGNWSEGITTYLADHLIQEQQGSASQYRRDALQSYATYVTKENEYTLKDFRGHHDQTSQAIGYGKSMMLLHMLRMYLGDETFIEGLRLFYTDNLFKLASYNDLQQAMEQVSHKDLSVEFHQWTERTGAPALGITDIVTDEHYWGYQLSFTLRQTQPGEPFRLRVPVYIQTADTSKPIQKTVAVFGRDTRTTITLQQPPLAISVDPLFDLFRHLDPSELPSSLGQLFKAKDLVIVLPSQAEDEFRHAYRSLANDLKTYTRNIDIVWDHKLGHIPEDKAVCLLGKENLLSDEFMRQADQLPIALRDKTLHLNHRKISLATNSFVLTNHGMTIMGWLHGHSLAAVHELARKIRNYGKYSYLTFTGDENDDIRKGQWPVSRSNLDVRLVAGAPPQDIPEHSPLANQTTKGAAVNTTAVE